MDFELDDVEKLQLDADTFLCQICYTYPIISNNNTSNDYNQHNSCPYYYCKICNKLFCKKCILHMINLLTFK